MKTICLCLVFLCALPAFGESAGTNFLAKIFGFNNKLPEAPPGTVVMQPFNVSADKVDTPSQITRDLERLFDRHSDREDAEIRKEASLFGPISIRNEKPILFDPIENLFVPGRDLAVKLQDGFQISPNFTIRIRNSGLMWKFGKHDRWSVGLKPHHGGVKLTIRRDL